MINKELSPKFLEHTKKLMGKIVNSNRKNYYFNNFRLLIVLAIEQDPNFDNDDKKMEAFFEAFHNTIEVFEKEFMKKVN